MDIINLLLALVSIFFGVFGWLAPKYTMKTLDMSDGGSTMGTSEVRAASGALFVFVGVGALIINMPAAYAMIGFAWGGGGIGRLTSLILDGQTRKKWIFFAVEVLVAVVAIGYNLF
ncbi:MAG: DUF4345 family protein [Shimia sp.]